MSPRTTAAAWTAAQMPDQRGRTAVVTGANTGLGFETARLLAASGARVVLACRDLGRGGQAADRIAAAVPAAELALVELDLASLASVRAAAAALRAEQPRLDLLINNAGVISARPARTADGFEAHLGTNHLGPFALTGLLLERLLATPGSRVVTVASNAHRQGRIHFDDLQLERGYRGPMTAYSQSKLANLMFTYELQRRLAAADAATAAVAAHPGNSFTDLVRGFPRLSRLFLSLRTRWALRWLAQEPEIGALATLRAAVDPQARGGEYYGPPGRLQYTGYPERVESTPASHDVAAQQRLWHESERLTGVVYPLTGYAPNASC